MQRAAYAKIVEMMRATSASLYLYIYINLIIVPKEIRHLGLPQVKHFKLCSFPACWHLKISTLRANSLEGGKDKPPTSVVRVTPRQ